MNRALLIVMAMATTPTWACGELTVENAWIRAAPPGATALAGFATFSNPHAQSVLIQGASAAGFGAVEMHSMSIDEAGVMRMRQLELVEVKVGEAQTMAPGGNHLMLLAPQKSYKAGDTIDVALTLCEEKQQTVRFIVADSAPNGEMSSTERDHAHHH